MARHNNFIERSLVSALSFLRDSIFADEYASKKGILQSLDPRIKIVIFLIFILQVLLAKSIFILFCLYAFCLCLAQVTGIHLGFFLKRTWIFIPLFSLLIVLPALFSIFSPGVPWMTFQALGVKWIITRQGIGGAAFFIMRVITSVSFAILLSMTTRHFVLLKVLRIFKIPQVFVMTFGMCYRYIYLFVEILENTYLAIKSRVGTRVHRNHGQHIVTANMAFLWVRSYQLNEDVYKAMLSRGYRGEPVVENDFKTKPSDWVWLGMGIIFFVTLVYVSGRANI